jgi:hypothetical protein
MGVRSKSDSPIAHDAAKKGVNASKENDAGVDASSKRDERYDNPSEPLWNGFVFPKSGG